MAEPKISKILFLNTSIQSQSSNNKSWKKIINCESSRNANGDPYMFTCNQNCDKEPSYFTNQEIVLISNRDHIYKLLGIWNGLKKS